LDDVVPAKVLLEIVTGDEVVLSLSIAMTVSHLGMRGRGPWDTLVPGIKKVLFVAVVKASHCALPAELGLPVAEKLAQCDKNFVQTSGVWVYGIGIVKDILQLCGVVRAVRGVSWVVRIDVRKVISVDSGTVESCILSQG